MNIWPLTLSTFGVYRVVDNVHGQMIPCAARHSAGVATNASALIDNHT